MDKKKKNQHIFLKTIITILYFLALVLAIIPFSKYFVIATQTQTKTIIETNKMPDVIPKPQEITAPTIQNILSGANNQEEAAIGQIVIPKVDISQPIYVGLTLVNMGNGVVSLFPNRLPQQNSLTIIGHHLGFQSLLFGRIAELTKGDKIFTRYLGTNYEYQVESLEMIKDTDFEKLEDQGPQWLYLITCEASFETPNRVLVKAKKLESQNQQKMAAKMEQLRSKIKVENTKNYSLIFLLPIFIVLILTSVFLHRVWRK
ncbi:MAG: class A sortase [Streptococcaceae bacterium]|jgi:sortase A|nr:class A sortase [Streptococcaceae bacterium]